MALWGSNQSDLQSRIDDIQTGLAAIVGLLGDGASVAGKSAARGAHTAQERVSEKAGDVTAAISPVIADLATQLESILSSASALTGKAANVAKSEGGKAYKVVENKVENNAMMAVVAAAGVGFLLGTMLFGGAAAKRAVSSVVSPPPQRRPATKTAGRRKPRRKAA